jgi:hypothetical protein
MIIIAKPLSHPPYAYYLRILLVSRLAQIQTHLFPSLCAEFNSTSPKLEKLIHILEWIQLDQHLPYTGQTNGRPTKDRLAIACAFVAKAVLNLGTTRALIDRLSVDRMLQRICGFEPINRYRRKPHSPVRLKRSQNLI